MEITLIVSVVLMSYEPPLRPKPTSSNVSAIIPMHLPTSHLTNRQFPAHLPKEQRPTSELEPDLSGFVQEQLDQLAHRLWDIFRSTP